MRDLARYLGDGAGELIGSRGDSLHIRSGVAGAGSSTIGLLRNALGALFDLPSSTTELVGTAIKLLHHGTHRNLQFRRGGILQCLPLCRCLLPGRVRFRVQHPGALCLGTKGLQAAGKLA
jgi:hypothetical protein